MGEKSSGMEGPVNTTAELAEAFQLGAVLSRIETTLGHNTKVIERTDSTVSDISSTVNEIQITQGRHSEQIATLFNRIEGVEHRQDEMEHAPPVQVVARIEFDELKSEVKSGRLSWGKVSALIVALVGTLTLLNIWDQITPPT